MVAGASEGHDRNPISKKPSTVTSTSTCTSKMTYTWTLTCHVLVDGLSRPTLESRGTCVALATLEFSLPPQMASRLAEAYNFLLGILATGS
jgi:hypothetical protein